MQQSSCYEQPAAEGAAPSSREKVCTNKVCNVIKKYRPSWPQKNLLKKNSYIVDDYMTVDSLIGNSYIVDDYLTVDSLIGNSYIVDNYLTVNYLIAQYLVSSLLVIFRVNC